MVRSRRAASIMELHRQFPPLKSISFPDGSYFRWQSVYYMQPPNTEQSVRNHLQTPEVKTPYTN